MKIFETIVPVTGSHEVRGSILLDSTNNINSLEHLSRCSFPFWCVNSVSNVLMPYFG